MCNCNKCNKPKNKCIDPCYNCQEQPVTAPCLPTPCVSGCLTDTKALCTFYNGVALNCTKLGLEINTGDNVELIIQKLFTALCNNTNSNCCFPSIKIINLPPDCSNQFLYISKIKKDGVEIPITTTNFPGFVLCNNNISMNTGGFSISTLISTIDPTATYYGNEEGFYQSVHFIEIEYICSPEIIC